MINCLFVGMGGFIGSVCRYLLGLLPVENSQGFPVKTLIINVTGAFVIGIVAAAAAKNTSLDPGLVLFLKVGICGGFTTFSTFAYETGIMMEKGQIGLALLYVILSAVFGVLAVFGRTDACKIRMKQRCEMKDQEETGKHGRTKN